MRDAGHAERGQNADERIFYALERIWKDCPLIPLPAAALAGNPASNGNRR